MILAASVATAPLVLELWLRFVYPVGAPVERLDAELLSRPIPGARSVQVLPARTGGRRVRLRINSLGMRGPEPARDKAGPRVVVYGDSLVMAGNVEYEQCYPARLAARLGERSGKPVEGLNAGVTGWGPDQSWLLLESGVDRLHADLVVLVLCANNDLGDLMRNKLVRLDERGELVRANPSLDARLVQEEARVRRTTPLALLRAWRELARSRAGGSGRPSAGRELDLLVPSYLRVLREDYEGWILERSTVVHNLFSDVYEADVAIQPESSSARAKLALMGALLGRFRASCAQRSLPLFVLVVPSAVDLDPDFGIRVDPALYPQYDPRRLSRELAELARLAGAPALDLFDAFLEAGPAGCFEGGLDFHWSARGIDLAASLSADRVLAEGLLD